MKDITKYPKKTFLRPELKLVVTTGLFTAVLFERTELKAFEGCLN